MVYNNTQQAPVTGDKVRIKCALTALTRIWHTIFEPMAALMLKYLAMALLLQVSNPSIFNPGTTFLWTHPVDPMKMMTILHEYVLSRLMSSHKGL